ncbi:P-loop containing nucleoside triphosphate hydrolase protein [Scleroderma yunnanense]
MGPTGAGKSSFVSRATGAAGDGVGHTLTSHTSEIKATRYKIGGASVVLVDTPGFDDTKKSDLEILESIANWLGETYKEGALLSALLYFHRITDNRMAGTPLKNLRVFQRLCGNNAMSQIVLTTTMWDEVDEEEAIWKPMIAQGSTTFRYLNTQESAMELIVQLVAKKRREVRLQKEIANKHMELRETSAGQELHSRLDQLAASQMQILERLRTQLKEGPTEDLRKEFETVKAQLNDTMRQSRSPQA